MIMIYLSGYKRDRRSRSDGPTKRESGSPGKFTEKGRRGGGDSVVDEEVVWRFLGLGTITMLCGAVRQAPWRF